MTSSNGMPLEQRASFVHIFVRGRAVNILRAGGISELANKQEGNI